MEKIISYIKSLFYKKNENSVTPNSVVHEIKQMSRQELHFDSIKNGVAVGRKMRRKASKSF